VSAHYPTQHRENAAMHSLNVALIGYGYAGKTFHAPVISHTPGLTLAAIMVRNPEQAAADWPQARLYDNIETLLAQQDIDLVVIATPNDSHAPLARQALLAGKHVVVDKPFTTTLDQARQLTALAAQCGRLLSVFHNRRWDADFLTAAQLITSGRLGRIAHFESHMDRFRPQVRQRWREQSGAGSGLWYDLGPHLIDQALQLFGQPETIYADLAALRDGAVTDDYFHVLLGYPQQRVILHGGMLVSGGSARYLIHGTAGSYIKYGVDPQEEALKRGQTPADSHWGQDDAEGRIYSQADEATSHHPYPNLPGDYRQYYARVRAAIVDKAPNPVPPEDAIAVMRIIELAIASSSSGRVLPLAPQETQESGVSPVA
jgi:predicted dehydrogenase